jgi:putative MATE family efflux protein
MVVSNSLMMLGPTIDMVWVGRLGSASVAGVGVAGIAVQLVMAGMMGLTMGMRAMIARFIGQGDVSAANHVARQALVLSAAVAIIMALVGEFFAEPILAVFGLEAEVVAQGAAYMRVMFIGSAAMAFRMMAEAVMQASGDAMTPMTISIVYRLFHVALCPFLIFGWWIFPRMGVVGAATTNVISQSLSVVLGMWVLFSGRSRLRLSLRNFRLDPNIIWRIVKIGFPALISGIQRTFSQFFLMFFMAPFGTIAVAAHSLIQRIEMFLFMPGMAFGNASGVLVGQNLGANQPDRAEKSAWLALGLVEAIMVVCSALLLLWPEATIRIFNSEPDLVNMGGIFIRIAVAGYVVLGLQSVLMQSISGAGDTFPPMIISLVTVWAVQLPMAYFLPKVGDLGAYGVRWAVSSGMIVGSVAYLAYFRLGRWKRKKV